MPEPAYEARRYAGSGAQYGGPGAQYAGPSQDYPDLARQYAPGTGGRPRRGRRRAIWLIAAAVVIAAAAGGGAAYALHKDKPGTTKPPPAAAANSVPFSKLPGSVQAIDRPSTSLPAGFTTQAVQPSQLGTTAGFTIDVPTGWVESHLGMATYFKDPNSQQFLEVDLTPHTYDNMVTEANHIERQSLSQGKFPNYKRLHIEAVPILSANGGFWQFTWKPAKSVKLQADDLLFIDQTSAGKQSYALYFRGPSKGWGSTYLPLFEKMLHTFQTIPS